jgi:hypothetical protein
MHLAGMASNRGRNLRTIADRAPGGVEFAVILANDADAPVLDAAAKRDIPTEAVPRHDGEPRRAHERRVLDALEGYEAIGGGLDPDVLVPMHGPELTDPEARIETSLADAERTEARLLRFLDEHGPAFAREFVIEGLGVDGPRTGFITLIIYEYLHHLAERGDVEMRVTDEGIHAEL